MDKYQRHTEEALKLYNDGYSQRQICKLLTQLHGSKFDQSHLGKALRSHPGYKPRSFRGGDNISNQKPMPDWYREDKIEKQIEENGLTVGAGVDWKHAWLKDKNGASIFVRNSTEVVSFDEMRNDLMLSMKEYAPKFTPIKRKAVHDPHLLVIDPADLHVGKLADPFDTRDTYNHEIAIERALEGIDGILQKASGFPIEKILFVVGSDILHVDSKSNTTTSGTPQDVSQKWYRSYLMARDLYIRIVETLMLVADVHIQYNPDNHAYHSGFMLVDSLYCWFRESKNITWNIDMTHRKYYKYGNSLIGTSHGDSGKMEQLPLAMSLEAKDYWADCKYYYWYLEHIHHRQYYKFMAGKDTQGVSIEFLRSASGTDSWHAQNIYANNFKAIEAFIHHKENGQIAKFTHLF
jgi:hypothetical protein